VLGGQGWTLTTRVSENRKPYETVKLCSGEMKRNFEVVDAERDEVKPQRAGAQ
jgi:hypothetical protein